MLGVPYDMGIDMWSAGAVGFAFMCFALRPSAVTGSGSVPSEPRRNYHVRAGHREDLVHWEDEQPDGALLGISREEACQLSLCYTKMNKMISVVGKFPERMWKVGEFARHASESACLPPDWPCPHDAPAGSTSMRMATS